MLRLQKCAAAPRLAPTPPQILGPFYPLDPSPDAGADLVGDARGDVIALTGTVMCDTGAPLPGALVEAWQCDANGIYPHPHAPDHDQVDPGFIGYGRSIADHEGRYALRALKPVGYPGRAPHLHLKISLGGAVRLITQMYVAGEPENQTDFALWRSGDQAARSRLIALFTADPERAAAYHAAFDIVLAAGDDAR